MLVCGEGVLMSRCRGVWLCVCVEGGEMSRNRRGSVVICRQGGCEGMTDFVTVKGCV